MKNAGTAKSGIVIYAYILFIGQKYERMNINHVSEQIPIGIPNANLHQKPKYLYVNEVAN